MAVLSAGEIEFYDRNGYVVVRNAVPKENIDAVVDAIWEFLEMDPDLPDTWYPEPPRATSMTEMYHRQAMWDNRQAPRVHEAFADVIGSDRLWVSIDRVSMNPPVRAGEWERELGLHWDMSLDRPLRAGVQGVLYLSDAEAGCGGFECVPGFHRRVDEWLNALPDGVDPTDEIRRTQEGEAVPGRVGDLVVWTTLLPHGHGMNTGTTPRLAQYIAMSPANDANEAARSHRVRGWRERLTGLPQQEFGREHREGATAELTPLGRKLLGLDDWDGM